MEEVHSLAGQKKQGWVWKVFARGNPRQWEQGGWACPGLEFRGITGQFHLVCCNQPESGMHSTYILLQNLLSDSIQLSKPVLSPRAWPHPAIASPLTPLDGKGWLNSAAWVCNALRTLPNASLGAEGTKHFISDPWMWVSHLWCRKDAEPCKRHSAPPWWDTQDTWTTQRAARPPRTPGAFIIEM